MVFPFFIITVHAASSLFDQCCQTFVLRDLCIFRGGTTYTSLILYVLYFAPLSLFRQHRSNGMMFDIIEILSHHSSAEAEEIHEKSVKCSKRPGRNSNRGPPKYKSRTLSLRRSSRIASIQ